MHMCMNGKNKHAHTYIQLAESLCIIIGSIRVLFTVSTVHETVRSCAHWPLYLFFRPLDEKNLASVAPSRSHNTVFWIATSTQYKRGTHTDGTNYTLTHGGDAH